MNSKKIINSEYGLSHQGFGLNQGMEYEIFLFDSFLDAKGGGGSGSSKGGNPFNPTPSDPSPYYLSRDSLNDTVLTDEFNIKVNFEGDLWSQYGEGDAINLKAAFEDAAQFLSDIITDDVFTGFITPETYDGIDLTIDASIVNIDGLGGVLGRAGPTHIWNPDLTPKNVFSSKAIMEFDSADAVELYKDGLWDEVILHEMMHCLGLGTLWEYTGIVTYEIVEGQETKKANDDVYEYIYNGDFANASATKWTGDGAQVEQTGGSGTAGGHWDEDAYKAELMTGYLNPNEVIDGNFYLSEMTFAALEDLGYSVTPPTLDADGRFYITEIDGLYYV